MRFLNPAGAWALLALLGVLALYMLRRRHEHTIVPSIHLWQLTARAQQVERPIEKLKKNLLMFLQLLLALLLTLSLMQPAIQGGTNSSELVLIFDISASMQAEASRTSRIDVAKREAARMLDALPSGSRVSILCAGSEVRQLLSRASSKQQILRTVDQIQAGNADSQLPEALSLARAIRQELPDLEIVLFSDKFEAEPEPGVRWIPVGTPEDNRAIVSLSASMRTADSRALARVANYGAESTVQLECYADDVLCDVRSLALAEGETGGVTFEIPDTASVVRAKIATPDALPIDNERFAPTKRPERARVVLAGKSNIFLEKALLLTGADLVKSTAAEAASITDAELYVFDGECPESFTEKGALLLVNPPESISEIEGFILGASTDGGSLRLAQSDLTEGMTLSGVQLRKFRPVNGGETLLSCNGHPAMAFAEQNSRRTAVIGFDLHESNLPVKYDFPVLMHNLLNTLLPDALSGTSDALSGQRIEFQLSARAESAEVLTPSGKRIPIAPPFPALPLTDTNEVGVYTLSQRLDDGSIRQTRFALSVPPDESDVRRVSGEIRADSNRASAHYGRDWTPYLLMALLGLMLIEWWVSRRED